MLDQQDEPQSLIAEGGLEFSPVPSTLIAETLLYAFLVSAARLPFVIPYG